MAPCRATRRRVGGIALVLGVLLLGGAASGGVALAVSRGQQRLATQTMDHYLTNTAAAVQNQVNQYAVTLSDLAAGISTQSVLTSADFAGMTTELNTDRLPGVSGVSFVIPAQDGQLAGLQKLWRGRGATGLVFAPNGTDVQHRFVIYGRSFTGTPIKTGTDLLLAPTTSTALSTARQTRAFTMSQAHVLLRDQKLPADQQQMSFTLAVPVLAPPDGWGSRALRGWVVMGVHGSDFLTQTLRTQANGAIHIQLADPSSADNTLIASLAGGTAMHSPRLNRTTVLYVGQHQWRLSLQPTISLLSATDRRITELALSAGGVFTLLLTLLIAVLVSTRNRALNKVDQATAALRQDIERRQAVEERLRRSETDLRTQALHDQMTGLANRTLFYERVGHALLTHARAEQSFAVFFIDLDGFKQVNDDMGHSAGDFVLREVSKRLIECTRDSDTVARFGGDEFSVLLERLAGPEDVIATADRIVDAVRRPITIGNREAVVTASVGIALNRTGDTADDILREADMAMYTAKTTGKCRHVLAGSASP
jgi:diguanylate cyclase (GGDEF)-like protein